MRQVHPGEGGGRGARRALDPRARRHAARRAAAPVAPRPRFRFAAAVAAGRDTPDGGRPGRARGAGDRAGAGVRRVGGDRPLLGLDDRVPGLRPRPAAPRVWPRWWRGRRRASRRTSPSSSTSPSRWRRPAGAGADRMERLGPEFAARVREGFAAQAAADAARWLVVDGTRDGRCDHGAYRRSRARASGTGAGARPLSDERPSPALFEGIVGQDDAVAALKAAAVNPVHAYLFRGPEGNGGLAAAYGFAAALLCPDRGVRRLRHLPGRAGRHRSRPPHRATQRGVACPRTPCARSWRWPSAGPWPRRGR